MSEPLIHFLVPFVGRLDYLSECVMSAVTQTDPRWILTVVEDGDQRVGASAWVDALSDQRVEHLLNASPLGLAGNFQHCVDLGSAMRLVIMGCDDRLLPGYVSAIARTSAIAPDAAVIQPGVRVIDPSGRPITPIGDRIKSVLRPRSNGAGLNGDLVTASLMRGNWTYFPSLCWRTDVLREVGPFRVDLPTTLDLELLARVLMAGHSLVTTDEIVFEYRRHAASASSRAAANLGRFDEEQRLASELAQRFAELEWHRATTAARHRVTSRLHAATLLPSASVSRDWPRARRIMRHTFGRSSSPASGEPR